MVYCINTDFLFGKKRRPAKDLTFEILSDDIKQHKFFNDKLRSIILSSFQKCTYYYFLPFYNSKAKIKKTDIKWRKKIINFISYKRLNLRILSF